MSAPQQTFDFANEAEGHSLATTTGSAVGRRPSPKQAKILAALKDADEITLADAVKLIGGNLYCNAEKHVGVTLSGMVKRGMIERVKPGVFRLPNSPVLTRSEAES
ncbi:hypothetical protein RZS08_18645 [Arthrospira platensis SPKY1]|nr:hypothetical protein [Arthrospira platensis SPKY1]